MTWREGVYDVEEREYDVEEREYDVEENYIEREMMTWTTTA